MIHQPKQQIPGQLPVVWIQTISYIAAIGLDIDRFRIIPADQILIDLLHFPDLAGFQQRLEFFIIEFFDILQLGKIRIP